MSVVKTNLKSGKDLRMSNEYMGAAKKAKNDEFYTQYADIEAEMNAYLSFDPDVFRGKTVLLPCDDPEWSNFTKYFAQRFQDLGIKRLISTSYAPNSKPKEIPYQPPLFELESPDFDEVKTQSNGKIFTLTKDNTGDGAINFHDLEWSYLEGDGDFRSEEITRLRDEADMVITNPPFSLFREFVQWLIEGNIKFAIIGNKNAITYKEVFPLIMENKLWLGSTSMSKDMLFGVPENIAREFVASGKEGSSWRRVNGQVMGRSTSVWFANMEHGRRHEPLALMTQEENLRFNKAVKDSGYLRYDNYDAIEVPRTDAIPSDYKGVMGVPISFLDKYNPDQFEIICLSRDQGTGMTKEFIDAYFASGQTGQISEGHPDLSYFDHQGKPVVPYRRILIKHRKPVR